LHRESTGVKPAGSRAYCQSSAVPIIASALPMNIAIDQALVARP
jgi:hypothetical protein